MDIAGCKKKLRKKTHSTYTGSFFTLLRQPLSHVKRRYDDNTRLSIIFFFSKNEIDTKYRKFIHTHDIHLFRKRAVKWSTLRSLWKSSNTVVITGPESKVWYLTLRLKYSEFREWAWAWSRLSSHIQSDMNVYICDIRVSSLDTLTCVLT